MKPPSINKVIFWLVSTGLILVAIKGYYSQLNMEANALEQKFGWYYKLEIMGNVLISIASILSFLLYNKYFPLFASVCYLGILCLVFICSMQDYPEVFKSPNFMYSIRGIGTFTNFGLMFYAANFRYMEKLLKVFYGICIFFLIAGFINLTKVGIGATRQQYLWAIRDLTVVIIWVFPFFFLQNYENKKFNLINTIIFFIILIFVLCTGSRSYLIIYALYLLTKFRHLLQTKNGAIVIAATLIIGAGVFFTLAESGLSKTLDGAVEILSERSNEDSRSGQLKEFIHQWDTDYLIQGVGPLKKWYWTNVADYYDFLDNQFLLLGWWAGLPVLMLYIFLLVKTYFTKAEINRYKPVAGIKMIIGLWILACLGFAIYITISSSLYYHFIKLMLGYQLCQYSKIKDFETELETTS
jgi:hypothetical protein